MYWNEEIPSNFDLGTLSLQFAPFPFFLQNFLLKSRWSRRFFSARLFALRDFRSPLLFSSSFDSIEQPFPRQLAIHRLRAGILNRHADTARLMSQCHGS